MAKGEFTMLEVAGHEVRLSNPAKVYFPKPGWTKLDVARYYIEVADPALIHLRERPTVLKRFVKGIMEEPIWQKRVPKNIPDWLQTATVSFPSGRTAEELVANDAAHLVWAVNLGVIDFNPWPARRADLDHPDELRVDLDPTPGITWDAVRRTAMVVREVLGEHGLRGYPKTSGSKGIHVNVRIEPDWDFLGVRRAALAMAREVERRAPDLATTQVVEGGAPRGVRRLQPERPRPHGRVVLLGAADPGRTCLVRTRVGRGARCRAGRPAARHRAGPAARAPAIPPPRSTSIPAPWISCWSWRAVTRRRASATLPGRRTSPSSAMSPSASSRAATGTVRPTAGAPEIPSPVDHRPA